MPFRLTVNHTMPANLTRLPATFYPPCLQMEEALKSKQQNLAKELQALEKEYKKTAIH